MLRKTIFNFLILSLCLTAIYPLAGHAGIIQYTVMVSAGSNGSVSPNTPQLINSGQSLTLTATPRNSRFMVSQWKVDGQVAQVGGQHFKLQDINADHQVEVSFTSTNLMYAGGANSYLYYSLNNGRNWKITPTKPNLNNAIAKVFATNKAVYVTTTSRYVFYSTSNGADWIQTSGTPDNSRVWGIYVTNTDQIYIGTDSGRIFTSTNAGVTWTLVPNSQGIGNIVRSIFVNNNEIYAGSSDGFVYYSPNHMTWQAMSGSPDNSAIRDLYLCKNNLLLNTAKDFVYTRPATLGNEPWSLIYQTVYSFFSNRNQTNMDAGTESGHVYTLVTGNYRGFVSYTPINSLFHL